MDPAKTQNCHTFRALGCQKVQLSLFLGLRPPKRETVANFRPGPKPERTNGRTDERTNRRPPGPVQGARRNKKIV